MTKEYYRQAIETKYLEPTNTKGSRISVSAYAGRKIYSWNNSKDVEENHYQAALCFANSFGWLEKNDLVGGARPKIGYCFVLVEKKGKKKNAK